MEVPTAPRPLVLRVLFGFFGLCGLVVLVTLAPSSPALAQVRSTLAPGDEISVTVREAPSLIPGTFTVAGDGTVDLPEVGRVLAGGREPADLADEVQRRLEARGVKRATVDVEIVAMAIVPITVVGAVQRPGPQPVASGTRLLDALLAAGGLAAGHGGEVRIRRSAANGLTDQVTIPTALLVDEADPTVNLPVRPGDLVTVVPDRQIAIHFLGEVATTGTLTFSSRDRVTLLTAIARAGGLTETAAAGRIRILREDASGERQEIQASFKRILAGSDPDVELKDGDIVVVKESFF